MKVRLCILLYSMIFQAFSSALEIVVLYCRLVCYGSRCTVLDKVCHSFCPCALETKYSVTLLKQMCCIVNIYIQYKHHCQHTIFFKFTQSEKI